MDYSNKKSLTCYCQPPEECVVNKKKHSVCYSNTGCFHSYINEGGEPFESFGCFKNDSDHYLMTCMIKESPSFRIKCCQDGNYCNQKSGLFSKSDLNVDSPNSASSSRLASDVSPNQWAGPVPVELLYSDNEKPPQTKWHSHPSDPGLYYYLSTRPMQYAAIAMVPALLLLFLSLFLILMTKRQSCYTKGKTKKSQPHTKQWTDSMNRTSGQSISFPQKLPNGQPFDCPISSAEYSKVKTESTPCSHPSTHMQINSESCQTPKRKVQDLSSLLDVGGQGDLRDLEANPGQLQETCQKKTTGCWLNIYKKKEACHTSESMSKELSGTSGSGSGRPVLVQRTIARQIRLEECVGTGRFGEVWRGIYEGENVAVKIFSSRDEASWVRETTIFNRFTLQHENLIGYIASDITSRNGCTQLWIVMPFYPRGTLFDYLQQNSLSLEETLSLAKSAAAGLCYLHSEITGVHGKPGIVHRDVKSKNILIQSNLTCCIADLGLAIVNHPNLGMEWNGAYKAGTKRYMSPELLARICTGARVEQNSASDYEGTEIDPILTPTLSSDGSISPMLSFEILKASDVYAFGLVLWELARRCSIHGDNADPYLLPYGDYILPEPTFYTMYETVCINGIRPTLSSRWSKDPVLLRYVRMDQECWCSRPEERLSMLRIKKTLVELIAQVKQSKVRTRQEVISQNIPEDQLLEHGDNAARWGLLLPNWKGSETV